jgi:hypothetical protein
MAGGDKSLMNKELSHLSPQDTEALDALVEAGFDPAGVAESLRPRAMRLMELLRLLDGLAGYDGGSGDLVVERTLAAIEAEKVQRYSAAAAGGPGGGRLPMRELAAVMAIMLVGGTMLWPLMQQNRRHAQRQACSSHLQQAWAGLSKYAVDYDGALPSIKTHTGDRWDRLNTFAEDGATLSNSAHLFVAVQTKHLDPKYLECPDNDTPAGLTTDARDWLSASARHFSYQNQQGPHQTRLADAGESTILADVNPVFATTLSDVLPGANSPNHDGRGQNVLFGNGRVTWLDAPKLADGDLIYHPGRLAQSDYDGNELPLDDKDAFLVP